MQINKKPHNKHTEIIPILCTKFTNTNALQPARTFKQYKQPTVYTRDLLHPPPHLLTVGRIKYCQFW
jgi:hypothetical protein